MEEEKKVLAHGINCDLFDLRILFVCLSFSSREKKIYVCMKKKTERTQHKRDTLLKMCRFDSLSSHNRISRESPMIYGLCVAWANFYTLPQNSFFSIYPKRDSHISYPADAWRKSLISTKIMVLLHSRINQKKS